MIRRGSKKKRPEKEEPAAAPKLKGFDDYDLRLGDVMRGERATLGISLLDVQRELKIKANYIVAIENADPTAFKTPGFISGYVRSYARYLGLDPEWAYSAFCAESGFRLSHELSSDAASPVSAERPARREPEVAPGEPPVQRERPSESAGVPFFPSGEAFMPRVNLGAIRSTAVLVALIGGLCYGGWKVLLEVQRVQIGLADPTADALPEVAPSDPVSPDSVGLRNAPGVEGARAEALDRLYRTQALDLPVLTARDGPIAAIDPASIGALASGGSTGREVSASGASGGAEPVEQVAEKEVALDVAVFAVRPSWVRVEAADGATLFETILDAGDRYVVPPTLEQPPVLRTGNATAIYFEVDGRNYGPASDGPSVIKDLPLVGEMLIEAFAAADRSKDSDLAIVLDRSRSASSDDGGWIGTKGPGSE